MVSGDEIREYFMVKLAEIVAVEDTVGTTGFSTANSVRETADIVMASGLLILVWV